MTAEKVLAVARGEIGTVETSGNRTKYGAAYGLDGVYWCMIFVWWCFRQAGAASIFYDGGHCASCSQLMRWAEKRGLWVSSDYRAGDVLIYDFPGGAKTDHTGLCVRAEGGYVYAIEGNTSPSGAGSQSDGDGVYQKKRAVEYVLGAFRPEYASEKEESEMQRYPYLADIPATFRPIIDTLMTAGIICGDGSDPAGNGDKIDLGHDQVRTLVFAYRGGAFDRQLRAKGLPTAVEG